MAETDPNVWLVVTSALGPIAGWFAKALEGYRKKQEAVTKEMERLGADLIDERRQDTLVERAEKNKYKLEADMLREREWRWRTEHTEMAIENDALRAANDALRSTLDDEKLRVMRLNRDVDRYQLELSKTADIRPPATNGDSHDGDTTGPQQAIQPRKR